MEIISIILEILIVFEIGAVVFWLVRQKKHQPKDIRLQETSKMVRKILLNNKWENIDDIIGLLQKESIHINFRLR